MGIKARVPKSTFYIWADVSALPPPLNNCVVFFEYCVRHKVICVPGIFFDVNPFHRRRFHKSPYIDKRITASRIMRPRRDLGSISVQAAHVVRARVAKFEAGRQGHEGDHRPRGGGATTPSGRAAADGLIDLTRQRAAAGGSGGGAMN